MATFQRCDGTTFANLREQGTLDSDFNGEWLDNGDTVRVLNEVTDGGVTLAHVVMMGQPQKKGYVRASYLATIRPTASGRIGGRHA